MENELKAAKLLLRTMTDVLLSRDCINHLEAAKEHFARFREATKDDPEVYKAGVKIAREFVNAE